MSLDANTLSALKRAVHALNEEPHHPVPTAALGALMDVARPGLRLRLDMGASEEIGAPLIAIVQEDNRAHLLAKLTNRQKQVATLIMDGLSNRTIASELEVSVATVKDHVHAILGRLDLPSRTALIAASHASQEI